jgi:hypothetical protein
MRLNIFNLPNHSSRTMALELTQPLTEMSTGKCFWRVANKAGSITAIFEPIF